MRFNAKDRLGIPVPGFSEGIAHQRQFLKQSHGEKWTLLAVGSLPYLLAIYPALAVLLGRSEIPHYFGRYSNALFGLVVLTLALYSAACIGVILGNTAIQIASCLLLILWTFPVVANNYVSRISNIQTLLPSIRLLASIELAYLGFVAHRYGWKTWGAVALMAGASFGLLTGVADLAIPRILKNAKEVFQDGFGFREAYQLSDISENDIVLIGDSFVWGQGVSLQETFGKVLEADLKRENFPGRVFLLGEIGIGPKRYIEIAKKISKNHRAKRVLVAFYLNDMPERDGGIERYINMAHSLGRSSPVLRLMIEVPLRRMTPDVDSYHRYVIEQYDKKDSSFAGRWMMLRDQLAELRVEVSKHSVLQPGFTIMPLAVDFRSYPLTNAESDLRALASEVGFKVFDVFPALRDILHDGSLHRAGAAENHYDAQAHRVIGEALGTQILQ